VSVFAEGRVHFIGVGGAGMSAIAKVLLERGVNVSGSDLKRTNAVSMLEVIGARIDLGHASSHVEGASTVVVSSAIPGSNPELQRARELGIRILSRGEALASLLNGKRSIVVAGTHGKTTTTSMVVSIMTASGRDPTYLVGGGLNDAGTNARSGTDALGVAESDESDGSFLLLSPFVAAITNVEADHLDYWASEEAIRKGFLEFMKRVHPDGVVVVPARDDHIVAAARATGRRTVTFGDDGDVQARDWTVVEEGARFSLSSGSDEASVLLRVPGRHNVDNALAAAAACLQIGLSLAETARGLSSYRGVERRFQVRGRARGVTIVDDYAHHPTEVRATLSAAAPGPWQRVVAVFQPHRFSRTAAMSSEFGPAFEEADRIVITDVYGAGEQPVPGVSGKLVADAVCAALPGRGVAYLPHRADLLTYLERTSRAGDVLLTLGAGDITSVGEELLTRLEGTGT
jgi:UDP-N-acetylmuramate--alanine ligase